jgi:hypothetical protein
MPIKDGRWYIIAVEAENGLPADSKVLAGAFETVDDAVAHFNTTERMFLVVQRWDDFPPGDVRHFLRVCNFYHDDPRSNGYEGDVLEENLDYTYLRDNPSKVHWLGVRPSTERAPRHFRVFGSQQQCEEAGYISMGTHIFVRNQWDLAEVEACPT